MKMNNFKKETDAKNLSSKEDQLKSVRQDGTLIDYIKNPSEEVQLEAVKQYPCSLYYIKHKHPSEKVKLELIKKYGKAIMFVDNPSEELQLAANKRKYRLIGLY